MQWRLVTLFGLLAGFGGIAGAFWFGSRSYPVSALEPSLSRVAQWIVSGGDPIALALLIIGALIIGATGAQLLMLRGSARDSRSVSRGRSGKVRSGARPPVSELGRRPKRPSKPASPPPEPSASPPLLDRSLDEFKRDLPDLATWDDSEEAFAAPPEVEPEADEANTIKFYYATCRNPVDSQKPWYGSERAPQNTYGITSVHVPPKRRFGSMNRPYKLKILSLTLYEEKEDPNEHFIIKRVETLPLEEWKTRIGSHSRKDALIFIHGFNTSFEEGMYRAGQIFWDLQYDGVPVAFAWSSGGKVKDYVADKDSALVAGKHFRTLLSELAAAGIKRVNIIAHSMGNYMLLDALDGYLDDHRPYEFGEVVMAAPDVDRDIFVDRMPELAKAVPGLTLYASKHDRALLASMKLVKNIPRAGFVADGLPILFEGGETIDVSEIGEEMFGLGHGAFASQPSIINDIAQIMNSSTRPPNKRLPQLRGVPAPPENPKWWRFQG